MADRGRRPRITHIEREPGKLLWAINRIPTWIFKLRLGRLFGSRFAIITHRGRKSGNPHTVIVETADGSIEGGRLVYVVAYGKRAQWYKNLAATPAISIETAGRVYQAPRHEFLDLEGTEQAIASYWRDTRDSPASWRAMAFSSIPAPSGTIGMRRPPSPSTSAELQPDQGEGRHAIFSNWPGRRLSCGTWAGRNR